MSAPSKASPPIKPLSGVGMVLQPKFAATAPDWGYWLALRYVLVWEAALLTCTIEPRQFAFRDIFERGMPTDESDKRRRVLELHFPTNEATLERVSAIGLSNKWDMPRKLKALATKPTSAPAPGANRERENASTDKKATLTEIRVATILKVAEDLNYKPLAIPYGGKAKIERKCLQDYSGDPNRFTAATFSTAWKAACKSKRIEVQGAKTYRRR